MVLSVTIKIVAINLLEIHWSFWGNGDRTYGFDLLKLDNGCTFSRSLLGFWYHRSVNANTISTVNLISICFINFDIIRETVSA